VLIEQRFVAGIRAGTTTLTFRRWKRSQVVAGRRYRTTAGIIEVDAVDVVGQRSIRAADAQRAGYPSRAALLADLRDRDGCELFRVEFHAIDGPDPRSVLAADAALDADAVANLQRRLDRLDRAAAGGPWTATVLALIAARPGVRAGDLALELGRERLAFKVDVRKLKNLGLTESLTVGYRLSPRGEAFLRARHAE